jgi:glycine oxidase
VDPCSLIDAWAGFRPVTPDGLPIMDAAEIEGLYTATGHYRHGILLAPAVAKFMAELILRGRSSFDLSPFSRKRFRV